MSELSFRADKFQESPLFTTPATTADRSLRLRPPKEDSREVGIEKLMEIEKSYDSLLSKIPKELGRKENEALITCEEDVHDVLRNFQEREVKRLKESRAYLEGDKMIKEIQQEKDKILRG